MLLGVAFDWSKYKGIDVFIKLARTLPERFRIVLVGTSDEIDKQLPKNIISIHRTQNQSELASIYTAADLFINPTREDNFPTVNIEALACGTPVITFDTNGSPEIVNEKCGLVVDYNDVNGLFKAIQWAEQEKHFSAEDCRGRAKQYVREDKYKDYINLYV